MKYALITGASQGIGEAMSYEFAQRNYHLILVARDEVRLNKLRDKIKSIYPIEVMTISRDLSDLSQAKALYKETVEYEIEVIVNNAGFGLFGDFEDIELEQELNMINLNISALHVLTKLYVKDFIKKDSGYILNVASTAAFQSGPLMASYYATKAYVLSFTEAIAEELKQKNSNVMVSVLCPGPVSTAFQKRANIGEVGKLPTPDEVAKEAVKGLFKGKTLMISGSKNNVLIFLNRFISRRAGRVLVYKNQLKKK
ncbi:MAG: SDR family NAD(P)-dependent oxidoreductase [Turicibacter sp.]